MKTEREILEKIIDTAREVIAAVTFQNPSPSAFAVYQAAMRGEEIEHDHKLHMDIVESFAALLGALRRLRELEAARVAEDIETLTKTNVEIVHAHSKVLHTVIGDVRFAKAWADEKGAPRLSDSSGANWFPFGEWDNAVNAAKAQAYWRENYKFAVDETFDEATARVVKLPANQGRAPDGTIVTFHWGNLSAIAEPLRLIRWPRLGTHGMEWETLLERIKAWALSNVPEGIEIVEGRPVRKRSKVETLQAWFESQIALGHVTHAENVAGELLEALERRALRVKVVYD